MVRANSHRIAVRKQRAPGWSTGAKEGSSTVADRLGLQTLAVARAKPVLMSDPADFETWLSGSTEHAFKLARSYAAEQRRIVQSGADRADLLQTA